MCSYRDDCKEEREAMYEYDKVHSQDDNRRGQFEEMVIHQADRVRPIIKEQFLREYILGVGDTYEVFRIYCKTFDVDAMLETRMILAKASDMSDFEDLFFIKNTIEQYLSRENILLSTTINDQLLIITTVTDRAKITDILDKARNTVKKCYDYKMLVVYSKTASVSDAPSLYERLKKCMGYSFYSENDLTLCENEIRINEGELGMSPDYGAVEQAVSGGDRGSFRTLLRVFFEALESKLPMPAVAKMYCLELYVCILRCCGADKIERYMKGIASIQEARTLGSIKEFIEQKGMEIADFNAPEAHKIYSSLIRDTIKIIDENIENENLSLRWLAGTILYTNVDYLGKLFKKETGKNFSHYVMEKRMEMAKALIVEGKKDRIYEVAEKVGYGSNSQYFSQVFKKYTGVSPLEYKEFARLARENGNKDVKLDNYN